MKNHEPALSGARAVLSRFLAERANTKGEIKEPQAVQRRIEGVKAEADRVVAQHQVAEQNYAHEFLSWGSVVHGSGVRPH